MASETVSSLFYHAYLEYTFPLVVISGRGMRLAPRVRKDVDRIVSTRRKGIASMAHWKTVAIATAALLMLSASVVGQTRGGSGHPPRDASILDIGRGEGRDATMPPATAQLASVSARREIGAPMPSEHVPALSESFDARRAEGHDAGAMDDGPRRAGMPASLVGFQKAEWSSLQGGVERQALESRTLN
jgi:hypothetical protein